MGAELAHIQPERVADKWQSIAEDLRVKVKTLPRVWSSEVTRRVIERSGYSQPYVSLVLNGHERKDDILLHYITALSEVVKEMEAAADRAREELEKIEVPNGTGE